MADSISSIGGSSGFDPSTRATKFFKKLDANGDGKLDASELANMVKNGPQGQNGQGPSAADILKKLDTNGDGSVSADEFAAGAKKMHRGHKAKGAGQDNDGDNDQSGQGASAADGKAALFAEILKQLQSQNSSGTGSASTDPLLATDPTNSNSATDQLFAALDGNGNGSVSKDEVTSFIDKMRQQSAQGTLYSQDGTTSPGSTDPLLDIKA